MTVEGMRILQSQHEPAQTLERLAAAIARNGLSIIARIDHGAAAEKVGLELRPTLVVLFGNAKVGTPFMQAVPTVAIDLPQRALVWQDETGVTWLGYNDPAWFARRHGVVDDGTMAVMDDMLSAIAQEATGR